MSDDDHVSQRLSAEMTRVAREVLERVEFDDETERIVRVGLVSAVIAGVRIGVSETLAQAVEQGFDVHLSLSLPDWSFQQMLDDDMEEDPPQA